MGINIELDVIQTYLDTHGRPVLKVSRKNVVNEHQVTIQVTYRFPTRLMLQEPLLLTTFFLALFVVSMFLVRLDLSISKVPFFFYSFNLSFREVLIVMFSGSRGGKEGEDSWPLA